MRSLLKSLISLFMVNDALLHLQMYTRNANGSISEKKVAKEVHCLLEFNGHREYICLLVIKVSDLIFLAYNWFYQHNPDID